MIFKRPRLAASSITLCVHAAVVFQWSHLPFAAAPSQYQQCSLPSDSRTTAGQSRVGSSRISQACSTHEPNLFDCHNSTNYDRVINMTTSSTSDLLPRRQHRLLQRSVLVVELNLDTSRFKIGLATMEPVSNWQLLLHTHERSQNSKPPADAANTQLTQASFRYRFNAGFSVSTSPSQHKQCKTINAGHR